MISFKSCKYPTELVITIGIIIFLVIIIILLGIIIIPTLNFRPPGPTTTEGHAAITFTTTVVPIDEVTTNPASSTRVIKHEILRTIDRIASRGYDIRDILQELTLDLAARERGEELDESNGRKLDPVSLDELRQHLSEIRLDKNRPFLSGVVRARRREAQCRSSVLDGRVDFNSRRGKKMEEVDRKMKRSGNRRRPGRKWKTKVIKDGKE